MKAISFNDKKILTVNRPRLEAQVEEGEAYL